MNLNPLEMLRSMRRERAVGDREAYWQLLFAIARGEKSADAKATAATLDQLTARLAIKEQQLEQDLLDVEQVVGGADEQAVDARALADARQRTQETGAAMQRAEAEFLAAQNAIRAAHEAHDRAQGTSSAIANRIAQRSGELAHLRAALPGRGCPADLIQPTHPEPQEITQ